MEALKLHEMVDVFENKPQEEILYDCIVPYKKQLYVYFKNKYNCEPVLMVTTVTNTMTCCRIVPEEDFIQSILDYLGETYIDFDDDESETYGEYETISFNSEPLRDLITNN